MKNEWLDSEISALRSERIKKKQPRIFVFALILMCMVTAAMAYDTPHIPKKMRWSATWFCQRCGYENFDEIKTCGLCGKPKHRK